MDGHAAAAGVAGSFAQAVHVVCAGVWIGGHFPPYRTLQAAFDAPGDDTFKRLRPFSMLVTGFVLAVVITGVLKMWNVAGVGITVGAYAAVLGIKLLCRRDVLLAATNRFTHMPSAVGPGRARALRLIVLSAIAERWRRGMRDSSPVHDSPSIGVRVRPSKPVSDLISGGAAAADAVRCRTRSVNGLTMNSRLAPEAGINAR